MKYLTIALLGLLLTPVIANADQRFESHQGICHFAYDVSNDDNEVYFENCKNTIDVFNGVMTNGITSASGTSTITQSYILKDGAQPHTLSTKLKGADAGILYVNHLSAPNTPCVMVTSNYNAANDDDNETVYVSNDWNLEIDVSPYNSVTGRMTYTYTLACRNGVAQ